MERGRAKRSDGGIDTPPRAKTHTPRTADDPLDCGSERGRAVGPRSRAIADTFVVATCANRAHVRHHLPLYLDQKPWVSDSIAIATDVIKTGSSACDLCGSVRHKGARRAEHAKFFDTYARTSPRASPGSYPEQHIATSSDDERLLVASTSRELISLASVAGPLKTPPKT